MQPPYTRHDSPDIDIQFGSFGDMDQVASDYTFTARAYQSDAMAAATAAAAAQITGMGMTMVPPQIQAGGRSGRSGSNGSFSNNSRRVSVDQLVQPNRSRAESEPCDPEDLGKSPTSMAMSPRTRSISQGQLVLAREVVFNALNEIDHTPNSRKSVEMDAASPSIRAALAMNAAEAQEGKDTPPPPPATGAKSPRMGGALDTDSEGGSPRTVTKPPGTPPYGALPGQASKALEPKSRSISTASVDVSPVKLADSSPPSPPPIKAPAPSPRAVSSLGKTDLQALINARIKNSMSNRKTFNPSVSSNGPAGAIQTEHGLIVPASPPRSPKADRFNTKYLSPGGQTINFTTRAVNTPPTPKFQGKKKGVADVKWDSYDLVYGVAAGPDGKTTNYPKTKESTTWEVSYALDTVSHTT
mmetsp:Transcript_87004/g.246721  ORF Transcript_87004/g.246721 Transcript_87004/m.246721 type:complete len:413 (+) Transcript_87004:413-1651(+)